MSSGGPTGDKPEVIGAYQIIRPLAEGSQGTVYLAEQRGQIKHRVALKLFRHALVDEDAVYRFKLERQALARMDHDHIARYIDSGTTGLGQPYFVMEYVPGQSLTKYCDDNLLSIRERLLVFRQVCEAVQHAHQKGVIHRDLKPANVLVTTQGDVPTVKVVDFGLARAIDDDLVSRAGITEDDQAVGTIEYMSPEQAGLSGQDVDTRTDIYALGVILYELLVGCLPFPSAALKRAGLLEMKRIIREEPPPRPSQVVSDLGELSAHVARSRRTTVRGLRRAVSRDLEWLTLRCLEKERRRRYDSASAVAEDIDRYLRGEPVVAAPPSRIYRAIKWVHRNRTIVTATATVFVVVVIAAVAIDRFFRESVVARALHRRLADLDASAGLLGSLDTLYPELPAKVADMEQWKAEVFAVLDRRAAHVLALASVDAELARRAGTDDPDRAGLSLEKRDLERLTGQLSRLEESIPEVDARIATAARIARETVQEPGVAALWQEVIDDLKADPRFAIEIEPQIGLVPIGKDPASGLWEFAHLRSGHVGDASGPVPARVDGRLVLDRNTGLIFVLVPGGTFWMGAQSSDEAGPNYSRFARDFEGPPVERTVGPFFLSKYEMTQYQWFWFTREGGSENHPGAWDQFGKPPRMSEAELRAARDLLPVDSRSWEDCDRTLGRLDLRLPTEAEWEYAARAGGSESGPWPTGCSEDNVHEFANIYDVTSAQAGRQFYGKPYPHADGFPLTAPVDSPAFPPNGLGFHQMLGNLFEWTADRWSNRVAGEAEEGDGDRTSRGGSYWYNAEKATYSYRWSVDPSVRAQDRGVRPARDLRLR